MKYLVIIFSCLLFAACKSKSYYRMQVTYIVNNPNGKTRTVDRNQRLIAGNDSLAFVKATTVFNQRMEENANSRSQCDHFELYDHKGNLVKPR